MATEPPLVSTRIFASRGFGEAGSFDQSNCTMTDCSSQKRHQAILPRHGPFENETGMIGRHVAGDEPLAGVAQAYFQSDVLLAAQITQGILCRRRFQPGRWQVFARQTGHEVINAAIRLAKGDRFLDCHDQVGPSHARQKMIEHASLQQLPRLGRPRRQVSAS